MPARAHGMNAAIIAGFATSASPRVASGAKASAGLTASSRIEAAYMRVNGVTSIPAMRAATKPRRSSLNTAHTAAAVVAMTSRATRAGASIDVRATLPRRVISPVAVRASAHPR